MKKFLVITVLALFLALPVLAASTDFATDADITVSSVAGDVTADLTIISGSNAASWTYSSGALTVTDPDASNKFKIESSDTSVISFLIKNSNNANVACALNTAAGTSYVTLPTGTGTYTIYPSTTNDCDALCAVQTGASSYYHENGTYYLPTCGVLECSSPYTLSAASASTSTTCNPPGVSGGGGGGGVQTATPTTTVETPTTTTPTTPTTAATPSTVTSKTTDQIKNIVAEAATIAGHSVEQILTAVGAMRDAKAETASQTKYTNNLVAGLKNITAEVKTAITNFVNYGTPTTKILGAGERAGVVNSYKSAFGKIPSTESEWSDVIKIGNGRWPSATNVAAETKATAEFKKVYKRSPDMKQPNDNAAVTVISYGLRPANRNLNSEKAAIKSFKAIYGHAPVNAVAWDIVRAIAYSGATR